MKNAIIWVFGASAAGKETFIRKIVDEKPEKIINELGWKDKEIIACNESLEWIGQYNGDPKIEKRKEIPSIVARNVESKQNAVILIKGQDSDLENGLPEQICQLAPSCDHGIIFLQADVEQLYTRGQRKIWWHPENTHQTTEKWLHYQMDLLKKISSKLPIRAVESNTENYTVIQLPERLFS